MREIRCPDCGVKIGKKHVIGCEWGLCPVCGKQAATCWDHCYNADGTPRADFIKNRKPYDGEIPWEDTPENRAAVAEANLLTDREYRALCIKEKDKIAAKVVGKDKTAQKEA